MKKLLVVCAVLGLAGLANAELLIGFNVAGLPGNGLNVTSAYNAANIQSGSVLERGSGLTGSIGTNAFASTGWTVGLTADDALAAGDYYAFTITAAPGYHFTITNIEWRFSRSATGPTNMVLRSSLDSFSSDLALWIVTATSPINVSNSLALTFSPSVELRLIGYQAGAASGVARLQDGANFGYSGSGLDLAVYGEVVPIPEPGTVALLGLGTLLLVGQRKFLRR